MTFQTEIYNAEGVQSVKLMGRLDSATSSTLEKSLQTLFEAPQAKVLLDFSELNYISSAGLRVVLMAAKRAKQSVGRLVLAGLQIHVKEVFEISGFLKILEVEDSRALALAKLQA